MEGGEMDPSSPPPAYTSDPPDTDDNWTAWTPEVEVTAPAKRSPPASPVSPSPPVKESLTPRTPPSATSSLSSTGSGRGSSVRLTPNSRGRIASCFGSDSSSSSRGSVAGLAPSFSVDDARSSLKKQSVSYPSVPKTNDEVAERVQVVRKALQLGAPKYNAGKYDECVLAYEGGIEQLLVGLEGHPQGRMLERAVELAGAQHTSLACWTLRFALDAVADLTKPGRHPLHVACAVANSSTVILAMLHASSEYCHLFPEESDGSESAPKAAPGSLNIDAPTDDADKATPLHIACAAGNKDVVHILLQAKADVNVTSPTMGTIMDVVLTGSLKTMVSSILMHKELVVPPSEGIGPKKLSFARMKLSVCPERLGILAHSLQAIDLSGNSISSLCESFTQLQQLKTANFSTMLLRTFPRELLSLTSLETLILADNSISIVPPQVDRLVNLQKLDLSNNKIDSLPVSMSGMSQLARLVLDKNPLGSIPAEVIQRGTAPLLSYLEQLKGKSTTWKRIKLMLVGEEGTGKTSLLSCMTYKKQTKRGFKKRSKKTISTDGLQVGTWHPDDGIEFQTWDFGGQQFFLSSRCIYIVVFNVTNLNATRIRYWVRQIRATAKDRPPIFLVATHSDDKACTPTKMAATKNQLMTMFNFKACNIIDCVFVSTHTGDGVKQLVKDVVGTAKSHNMLKQKVPGTYALLDSKLQERRGTKQMARWGEYLRWAASCSVEKQNIESITQFLHDVGALIHFDNTAQLRDIVILDPQWLADIFASLVTFNHLWVKNGVLLKKDLPQVWKGHARTLYDRFLLLLTKFGVMYPIETKKGATTVIESYIVPPLLPTHPPATLKELWPSSPPDGIFQFGRIYRFDFTFDFSKLLVDFLHTKSVTLELYWKGGVVCSSGTQTALVRVLESGNELEIHVRIPQEEFLASKPLFMLRHLVEMADSVIDGYYPGSQTITKHIPCSHCLHSESSLLEGIYVFSVDEVALALASGSAFVHCRGVPTRPVNIRFLAPDLAMADFPTIDESLLLNAKKVAEGGFGIVYKAQLNGMDVAVKELKVENQEASVEASMAEFQIEVYIMSCLRHQCLVGLYGICLAPLRMVIEWCPEGDLWHFLRKHEEEGTQPSWELCYKLALDIALGMRCLHQVTPPIVHRDLRSPNIFLTSTNPEDPVCAKVADFGLSRHADHYHVETLQSWPWLAPEVINIHNTKYNQLSDIYSFGIVMWEIVTQRVPYSEYEEMRTIPLKEKIIQGSLRPTPPEGADPRYVKLMRRAWRTSPADRVSFDECVEVLSELVGVSPGDNLPEASQGPKLTDATYVNALDEGRQQRVTARVFVDKLENVRERPPSKLLFVPSAGDRSAKVWAGFYDGHVAIMDPRTGEGLAAVEVDGERVTAMVRAGLTEVWTASPTCIQAWCSSTFQLLSTMKRKATSGVLCLAVDEGDAHVWAGTSEGVISIWRVATHSFVRKMKVGDAVLSLERVRSRMWGGMYKQFIIFDALTFQQVAVGTSNQMKNLQSVGGLVWGSFNDNLLRVWSSEAALLDTLPGHTGKVQVLAAVAGQVWSGSFDTSILIWDVATRSCVEELTGCHSDSITCIADCGDFVWSGARDCSFCIWPKHVVGAPPAYE